MFHSPSSFFPNFLNLSIDTPNWFCTFVMHNLIDSHTDVSRSFILLKQKHFQ